MSLQNGQQVIKTRDDPEWLTLAPISSANNRFKLAEGPSCSWAKADEEFGPEKLRERIEPWLTALVQSEHLSLLVGSGLTHAVHKLATNEALRGMGTINIETFMNEIEAEANRGAKAAGRHTANFEDQLRVANELLRGLEIIASTKTEDAPERKQIEGLRQELTEALKFFARSILEAERNLASAPDEKCEEAFNYLVSFLMSFASRSGTRDRLHLFTTNYDRYIEAGADVAGLRLIDRFVGTLAPVFRASRLDVDLHYNPPGIRGEPRYLEGVARFTKLHGSIDWVDCHKAILRFGLPFGAEEINPYLRAPGLDGADAMKLMIYPNAAKDRETAEYPYVELFRDFAAAICRPNSTLVTYGYSFGDEHINRVIEDMLTIPSAHLVIISYSDPLGRIMRTYERLGRGAQITLLVGDHLGDLKALVDHYLPKPAIDRTTFRMAELLRKRFGAQAPQDQDGGTTDIGGQSL
ncbi:MAG: hypothetical protein PWR28_1794 [Synergistaceae bacterium]|nr:hypothetical protein [Synergistaceae bacterium]MDI3533449.1 hypothetical protein [Synergistaceae bacterium]